MQQCIEGHIATDQEPRPWKSKTTWKSRKDHTMGNKDPILLLMDPQMCKVKVDHAKGLENILWTIQIFYVSM